ERRSAELEQLRAETAQQREQLRQERIRATDQLQARHSQERSRLTDRARSESERLTVGGQDEQGRIVEGFRQRAKQLAARYADARERLAAEVADARESIKDMDKEEKPAARRALSEKARQARKDLKARFDQLREQLQADKSAALAELRAKQRAAREELGAKQKTDRRSLLGAAMPDALIVVDDVEVTAGTVVVLDDDTVHAVVRVASVSPGLPCVVLAGGRVVEEYEIIEARPVMAASLYTMVPADQWEHGLEVTWGAGERGVVCEATPGQDGTLLVKVRRISSDGTLEAYEDGVMIPADQLSRTGREMRYQSESGGTESTSGPDRVVTAAGAPCACGGGARTAGLLDGVTTLNGDSGLIPQVDDPLPELVAAAVEELRVRVDALEGALADVTRKLADVVMPAPAEMVAV
ncbi:MAG: hypothetical protein ACRCZI_09140, partial [Cetobacterium sp.]